MDRKIYGPPYDAIVVESIRFSPNGKRIAYVGKTGRKFVLVVDGEPNEEFDGFSEAPQFSADGHRLVFAFARGMDPNTDSNWRLFDNGLQPGVYAAISKGTPLLSSKGKRMAFGAKQAGRWRLFVNGEATKLYDSICIPVLSSNGSHYGCVFHQGGKDVLVIDRKEMGVTGRLSAPVFTDDGKSFAFAHGDDKTGVERFVVNDKPQPAFERVSPESFRFSHNGERFAYGAVRNKKPCLVIDGKESPPLNGTGTVGQIVFSPNSQRIAYATALAAGQIAVVVDGEQGQPFDALFAEPVFSPHSRHFAYVARRRGKTHIVVDDTWTAETFHGIVGGGSVVFDSNDQFSVPMIKGDNVVRADVSVIED